MKIEFNEKLIERVIEMELLWRNLVSWGLIEINDEPNEWMMKKWIYEHFNEDLNPFIEKVNEKYKGMHYPEMKYIGKFINE